MLIASLHFSICPGCVPPAKAAIVQALRADDAPPGLLSLHLAEVGEVNTLCAFFACASPEAHDTPDPAEPLDPLEPRLSALARWVNGIRRGPAGAQLRHVQTTLHHSHATPAQWATLRAHATGALLQRVYALETEPEPETAPETEPQRALESRALPPHSLVLQPLSGEIGLCWVLSPLPTHDAALALCLADTLEPHLPLRDSVLWLPSLAL